MKRNKRLNSKNATHLLKWKLPLLGVIEVAELALFNVVGASCAIFVFYVFCFREGKISFAI